VKGGDLNIFLQLTAFVILRFCIEMHTKGTFWRTVPLSVIYCLHMKEEQLWQNKINSALCDHSWQLKGYTVCTNCQDRRTCYRHVV